MLFNTFVNGIICCNYSLDREERAEFIVLKKAKKKKSKKLKIEKILI